jgi:PAS domain S-box-containing protein
MRKVRFASIYLLSLALVFIILGGFTQWLALHQNAVEGINDAALGYQDFLHLIFFLLGFLSLSSIYFAEKRETKALSTINEALQKEIAVRRQVEKELLESEKKFRTIFESTGTALISSDEDTTILMVNSEFERLSGYAKEEIEGKKSWTEFVVENDLERLKGYHRLRRADPNAAPKYHEFGFVDRRRSVKHVYVTAAMLPGSRKGVASFLDITEHKRMEEERERLIKELQNAVSEIKTLGGMLPICGSCKKIRDDKGYWNQIENYIRDHSEADFSHSICPDCAKKLYPELTGTEG